MSVSGLTIDFQTGLPRFKNNTWQQFSGEIPAGDTVVIDSFPLSMFDAMEYKMSFRGPSQANVRSLSMHVQNLDAEIKEQVFGRLGPTKIDLETTINGLNFELVATNAELYDVSYCLTVLTI